MSYHQTYRAVSTPVQSTVYNSSPYNPTSSVLRKPAQYTSSVRSISPLPPDSSQGQAPTYRSQPTNHLHGPNSPNPSSPLNSFPSTQQLSVSPSITPPPPPPPVPDYQQPNYRQQPRAFYDSPVSATSATFPQNQIEVQKRPQNTQKSHAPAVAQPPAQTQPQSQPLPEPQRSPAPSYTSHASSIQPHEIDAALQTCLRVQVDATTQHSKRPFAAILLAPDRITVLLHHNSISHYQHAESELARLAATQYAQKYLEKCTLVSTWEPCAMCAGTIYWTGIGRVIYAASESKLKELTGSDNDENLTMDLPCRTIFNSGQRNIEVIGPVQNWEERVVKESGRWWRENQLSKIAEKGRSERERSTSATGHVSTNGTGSRTSSFHEKATVVSVYDPRESVLGSIGEDGEYQADLKVDWMS